MTERKKNGFVIEMMMIFMLITFGFCILITTVILGLRNERKYSHANIQMQTDLNQIGEYYIRFIQSGSGTFPIGEKIITDFSDAESYGWMGDDEEGDRIKAFFKRINQQYKFDSYFTVARGDVFEFFETKEIWRKLVVTSRDDNQIKMIIELSETRAKLVDEKTSKRTKTADYAADYKIQSWSIGDALQDTSASVYRTDEGNLNFLQKLWALTGKNGYEIITFLQGEEGLVDMFINISGNNYNAAVDFITDLLKRFGWTR